jgi:hypothetical protein
MVGLQYQSGNYRGKDTSEYFDGRTSPGRESWSGVCHGYHDAAQFLGSKMYLWRECFTSHITRDTGKSDAVRLHAGESENPAAVDVGGAGLPEDR